MIKTEMLRAIRGQRANTTDYDELRSRINWSIATEVGDEGAHRLINEVGAHRAEQIVLGVLGGAALSADESVLKSRKEEWAQCLPFWQQRFQDSLAERTVKTAVEQGIEVIIPSDPEWPAQLNELGHFAPLLLWVKGDTTLLPRRSLAVVGSRAMSTYGGLVASEIVHAVAAEDVPIIAGLSYGIESAALLAALKTRTPAIAVLASGIDRPYPDANKALVDRIVSAGGLVVSATYPGSSPTRWRFQIRRRVLAALSTAVVVVESGPRGGALAVARNATALGHPVGAVPGPITSTTSAGCHLLISQSEARLVTSGNDMLLLVRDR